MAYSDHCLSFIIRSQSAIRDLGLLRPLLFVVQHFFSSKLVTLTDYLENTFMDIPLTPIYPSSEKGIG